MMFKRIIRLKSLKEYKVVKELKRINMFKKIIMLLAIITFIFPLSTVEAFVDNGELLIIYDDYKEYGSDTNNLNYIIKIALTTEKSIEVRKSNSYTNEDLNTAEGIIVLSNREGSFSESQIDELYLNSKNLLWIGKNSSKIDVVPLSFQSEDGLVKIKNSIYDKFVKEEDKKTNCYLVLDEVYPYDDLNLIIEKADYLYESGIPFLVNAMEVYNNLDFDAMKRYAETLRYCASKGGTIILGDPYVYNKGPTEEELIKNMGIAQDGFVNYGVYPIGLTINDYYLYRDDRVKYLENTSMIIINENENLEVIDLESLSIKSFSNVLIKIKGESLDFSKGLKGESLTNVAIGLTGRENINDFKEKVEVYKNNKVQFSNPKNLEGELTFGVNKINNTQNGVTVNGVNLGGNRFLSNEELYGSKDIVKVEEEEVHNENINLDKINKIIFLITIVGLIIFIIFFLYSLKIDKRKYFK